MCHGEKFKIMPFPRASERSERRCSNREPQDRNCDVSLRFRVLGYKYAGALRCFFVVCYCEGCCGGQLSSGHSVVTTISISPRFIYSCTYLCDPRQSMGQEPVEAGREPDALDWSYRREPE